MEEQQVQRRNIRLRPDPVYRVNRPHAARNNVEWAINVVLLESLADEFRITLTILGEEDFERSCFGRHICLTPNS